MSDSDIKRCITDLADKMDHKILVIWAADCAEHVLPYFNEKHPKDKRPQIAIEAGRAWARGEMSVNDARTAAFEAHAAARDARESAARAVARAAGHAAAAAQVANHAVHGADSAASAITGERIWQYKHLLKLSGNS